MNAEPLQFLYWRVDAMFEGKDADGDGMLDADEFAGEEYNFERIDLNADGFLTKQEVVDDMIPVLRAEGKIP
jgi:Ca2+-binding EF-hand superfamily protein